MMEKVVSVRKRDVKAQIREDLKYWLSKTPEERVVTVDFLRKQYHGDIEKIQKVVRTIRLSEDQ